MVSALLMDTLFVLYKIDNGNKFNLKVNMERKYKDWYEHLPQKQLQLNFWETPGKKKSFISLV